MGEEKNTKWPSWLFPLLWLVWTEIGDRRPRDVMRDYLLSYKREYWGSPLTILYGLIVIMSPTMLLMDVFLIMPLMLAGWIVGNITLGVLHVITLPFKKNAHKEATRRFYEK